MALTGRAAIAALIGTLVTLAFRDIPALVIVDALIAAAIITDCVLAAGSGSSRSAGRATPGSCSARRAR